MSRSDPPRSSIAARSRESDARAGLLAPTHPHPSRRRKVAIRLASLMRWLHIYLSMFGLAAVLFFSVTGITLNHPDWFFEGAASRGKAEGRIDPRWLHVEPTPPRPSGSDESDRSHEVARLEVVEHLRKAHRVRGAVSEFRADERECTVTFKGPGYSADAFIDRETGKYDLTENYQGLVAVLNDLHKGRDTGPAWSVVIDASAALMTIISLTGLVLLFYLKRRRMPGLAVALLGTAAVAAVAWLWVP